MLNERERSRIVDSDTRDLKQEVSMLVEEKEHTHDIRRKQWIDERVAFIESVINERNKVS